MKYFSTLSFICLLVIFISCNQEIHTPKPKGYYRIELPEHTYQSFDTTYPYKFEYSIHADILPDNSAHAEPYWIYVVYPSFNATLYISYKRVYNNIDTMIGDSRTFVSDQIKKADDIFEYHIHDTINQIYGTSYDIIGTHVACPYQFWLTDRKNHFFRASLYFNHTPNNDSIAPVIEYIKTDMLHLLETFYWKPNT